MFKFIDKSYVEFEVSQFLLQKSTSSWIFKITSNTPLSFLILVGVILLFKAGQQHRRQPEWVPFDPSHRRVAKIIQKNLIYPSPSFLWYYSYTTMTHLTHLKINIGTKLLTVDSLHISGVILPMLDIFSMPLSNKGYLVVFVHFILSLTSFSGFQLCKLFDLTLYEYWLVIL